MAKIVNLEQFKNKKNRDKNIANTIEYLANNQDTRESSKLDVQILVYLLDDIDSKYCVITHLNISKLAKHFGTSAYNIKKASNILIDLGVLEVVERGQRKPMKVSLKNVILALGKTEEYNRRKKSESN